MPTPEEIGIDSAFYTGPRLRKNHPSVKYAESDVSEEDVRAGTVSQEDQQRCGTCAFWRYGLCQLVEGSIDAFFTCEFFERPVRTFKREVSMAKTTKKPGTTAATTPVTTATAVRDVIQKMGENLVQSGKAANVTIGINDYLSSPAGQAMAELFKKLSDFPYDAMLAGRAELMFEKRDFSELPPAPLLVADGEEHNIPLRFLHKCADEIREADPTLTPVDALELAVRENPDVAELYSERMRAVSMGLRPAVSSFDAVLDKHGVSAFQLISMKAQELVESGECENLNVAIIEVTRREPALADAHAASMKR